MSVNQYLRRFIGVSAVLYAFGASFVFGVAALLPDNIVAAERLPIALDFHLVAIPTATLVIGWFKRDTQDKE